MKKEILLGEVIEIANDESNDIYMSLHIKLLTNQINLNKARFTDAFIQSVIDNQDFYNCMPLVVEREKIESGRYSVLGHAQKNNDTFGTDQVGGFNRFYSKYDTESDKNILYGVARVFKRFGKVCDSIQELYEQGKLFFSVEVSVAEYKKNTKEERVIDAHENNRLIGDCIVSFPAEKMSEAEILIAEQKEGEKMADKKNTEKDFFEKTIVIESSELDLSQIRTKVFNKCKESMGEDLYNFYCSEFGYNYLILEDYKTSDLFKVDYSVSENSVEISEKYSVVKTYVSTSTNSQKDDGNVVDSQANSNEENKDTVNEDKVNELNSDNEKLKNDLSDRDKEIKELSEQVESKDKEIVELKQNVNLLSEEVQNKKNEISELNKSKKELDELKTEIAEKEKADKQSELKEKYSKLLPKEVMESDESKQAVLELNSVYFKDLVVANALKDIEENSKDNVETASISDSIELHGSDVVGKYITRNE